jgi:hypothetical protein
MVERDPSGDEDDRPLKLRIIKPNKPAKAQQKPEPETVGVGAKGEPDGEPQPDEGDSKPDAE